MESMASSIASVVAFGPRTDPAPGDDRADVVFRGVGVEGNVRAFEDLEEAGAIGTDAHEQAVEGKEAGAAG